MNDNFTYIFESSLENNLDLDKDSIKYIGYREYCQYNNSNNAAFWDMNKKEFRYSSNMSAFYIGEKADMCKTVTEDNITFLVDTLKEKNIHEWLNDYEGEETIYTISWEIGIVTTDDKVYSFKGCGKGPEGLKEVKLAVFAPRMRRMPKCIKK